MSKSHSRPAIVIVRSLLTAFGGAEHAAALTAVGLRRRGYDVAVVTRPPVVRDHPYETLLRDAGVPVHAPAVLHESRFLKAAVRGARPFMFPPYYLWRSKTAAESWRSVCAITDHWLARAEQWWLRETLDRLWLAGGPTVLHVYGQEGLTPQLVKWAFRRGVPVVYTETGEADEAYITAHNLVGTIDVVNDISLIVCPGPTVARNLRRVYRYKGRIEEIPFLIQDPDSPQSSRVSRQSNDTVVIGAIGRLVDVKRHTDVIWATARLRERGLPVSAVIAGDGPLRDALQAETAAEGLSNVVRFTGRFDSLEPILNGIDVFLQTSTTEGQPLTVSEALAYGKPVVAYDCGDVAQVVHDGVNGFLIPSGDRDALVSRLIDLVRDREMRIDMGVASRQLFLSARSTETVLQRIIAAYESVLHLSPVKASIHRAVAASQ